MNVEEVWFNGLLAASMFIPPPVCLIFLFGGLGLNFLVVRPPARIHWLTCVFIAAFMGASAYSLVSEPQGLTCWVRFSGELHRMNCSMMPPQ